MSTERTPRSTRLLAALAGLVAGGVTLGVAEAVAAVVSPSSAPVLAVGSAFIDLTPRPLKDFAVENFGTSDKLVLLLGMGVVIALLAATAGALALRRPWIGRALVVLLGLVAVVAAVTRPSAGSLDALPSLVGTGAGVFALDQLLGRLRRTLPASEGTTSRRGFLVATGVAAAVAVVAGAGARLLGAGARQAEAARADLALPDPTDAAPAPPAGVQVDAEGMTPFVTPNEDFYRIDTALSVPRINPDEWTLRVHGLVDNEVEITWAELLERDLVETWLTLTCVSNEVGGELVGNAKWLGLPLRELLREAGPQDGADMVLSTSQDGWTAGTPLEVLLEDDRDCLLAIGMNGEPLPLEHGFPVRMVVPGSVRLRLGHQVGRRPRGHDVRGEDRVLDRSRVGPDGSDQDRVAHRRAALVREAACGTGGRGRYGLGPDPGRRDGGGAGRLRGLAGGDARRRGGTGHLAAVVVRLGRPGRLAHAARPCDRHGG